MDPSNPEISPSVVPWKEYKNEYYAKRGYTVAGKDWKVRRMVMARRLLRRRQCRRTQRTQLTTLPCPPAPTLCARAGVV